MAISNDTEDRVRPIADESLITFNKVAETAVAQLKTASTGGGSREFASMNTFTSTATIKNRAKIADANIEGYKILAREPAIARVVVADEDGQKTTYYFCRAAPVSLGDNTIKFASYRSQVGMLAECRVGDEYRIVRDGSPVSVEVVEHARFRPIFALQEWDARDTILVGNGYGPLSIDSLRELLRQPGFKIDASALDNLLEEESAAANIREGVRRGVVTKMDLRDQPILDRHQGEIFRLPLNSRLLILGPPGTGKTTTLIRRLGQKLDTAFLDDRELRMVQNDSTGGEEEHSRSWIMFTPTELLKLYVKEAFNREGVPAPDDRISTWSDYRDDLARNEFRILRSAASGSSLVMKEGSHILAHGTEADQIAWFSDFNLWQDKSFWDEMRSSAQSLSENHAQDVAKIGSRIVMILNTVETPVKSSTFVSLTAMANEIRDLRDTMKAATDAKIRSALNLQVNHDKQFLDGMAKFVEGLVEVTDDPDDPDVDEDEEQSQPRVGRAAAVAHYMRAVGAQARSRARKRSVSRSGPAGRLIEWLGDRSLSEKDSQAVGESLVVQSPLRAFINPIRRYFDSLPARYRRFRRVRQAERIWYLPGGFNITDIHPLEVDVLLLAMMRGTDDLIGYAPGLTDGDNPSGGTLEILERLYRTQVLVDEATDFSPIQLACMATLARPGIRSFFACGDFNQRVTNWGTRSIDEMKWVVPSIDTRSILVAYRQSRLLHDFAQRIVELSGVPTADVELPDYADNDGVPPVLVKNVTDVLAIAIWLASRISEIERSLRNLPSVAVLVNDEDAVHTIAAALGDALVEQNIRVIACSDGQVRGSDNAVRVFNVRHIKGLEFEAVFFVGIDQLAKAQPDLFDKYLYVGATRAATYLGLTCETDLPPAMAALEDAFAGCWG